MKLFSAGSNFCIRAKQSFVSSSEEITRRCRAAAACVKIQYSGDALRGSGEQRSSRGARVK
jgi:hypothetical protein